MDITYLMFFILGFAVKNFRKIDYESAIAVLNTTNLYGGCDGANDHQSHNHQSNGYQA